MRKVVGDSYVSRIYFNFFNAFNNVEHRIKELIKEKGFTQQSLADKLGMSRVGLNQLVNGKPSFPTLEKIAEALDVPMWQLFATREEVVGEEQEGNSITCPKCGARFKMEE